MNDSEIPGLLEPHRYLLSILAEAQLGRAIRRKLDPDDIVQEAMQRAYQRFGEVREPNNPQVVKGWLLTILSNVLKDHLRHFAADKRNIANEHSMAMNLEQSAAGIEAFLAADQTSPSMAASRNEELQRLAQGLAALPEELREIIVQKHINNKSLQEIATMTNRSVPSVAGLLRRGLARLRQHLS